MNIVLVDDTPDHLELLAEFVGELRPGANICCLQNALDLPACLARKPADLVMVDLIMPTISGFDLVRQLRQEEQWSNLPIVAVSGLRQVDHESELRYAGFNDYIVKPYEVEELARILDRHLPV